MEREGRTGEEAVRGSGRDKEERRDKSQRLLFLMKREEREVLILTLRVPDCHKGRMLQLNVKMLIG